MHQAIAPPAPPIIALCIDESQITAKSLEIVSDSVTEKCKNMQLSSRVAFMRVLSPPWQPRR